jgi:hypothetical protein
MSLPKINIITRTGTRENCFKNLKKSLETQTYKNYIHYKTNDNHNNTFLKNEQNVIDVTHLKQEKTKQNLCPYNVYLNEVINKIDEGWVIIIDDDAKFVRNDFLEKLALLCSKKKTNEIFLYNIYFREMKSIFPINNSLRIGTFDMASICIHSSLLKEYHFTSRCGGDFSLIYNLRRKGYIVAIERKLPIGIWGNYNGSRKGRNNDCC